MVVSSFHHCYEQGAFFNDTAHNGTPWLRGVDWDNTLNQKQKSRAGLNVRHGFPLE
jgi:hypothetical protein